MVQNMIFDLLKELSLAFGPSGCENNITEIINRNINDYADEIHIDKMGNLTALYRADNSKNSGKKIMIAAHMDEVGFMVTHIDDNGYLHFGLIGGIDPRVLCGRRVLIGDENARINGVIISKAIHLQNENERKETTPISSMYIDIGAKNREEAEKYAPKGTFGTFDSEYTFFGTDDSMIKAKALDDRLGCAVMCHILKRLREENIRLNYDIYFSFTVREEIGFSGAGTAAFEIDPDKAIILESTAIGDIADVPENAKVADIGKGGVISIVDNGTVYDRDFINYSLIIGKKFNIKHQIKRYVSGGNDAAAIQRVKNGSKVLALSAPCRYLHTASNVIAAEDVLSICDLLYHMIKFMEF